MPGAENDAQIFYASIYANLGRSYLHLGDRPRSLMYYNRALDKVAVKEDSDYKRELHDGIARALAHLQDGQEAQ